MSPPLRPLATLDELHPPGTALVASTRPALYAWVTEAADAAATLPGLALPVAGRLPLLAHPATAQPAARRLLQAAGLELPDQAESFTDEAALRRVLDRWVAAGLRLAAVYPLPPDWAPAAAHLVPPALLARLNSKSQLAELVPEDWRPERRVVPRERLEDALRALPGEAVVLKVATGVGNGAGSDVAFCRDTAERAEALRRLGTDGRPFDAVVVERREDFETIWCAGFAVLDEAVRWLGASRHRLDAVGLQAGNAMGDGAPLPAAARAAIEAMAERARTLGYRGLAGCDVGRTRDGRLLIFDLNFRLNASTAMLLVQPGAAARSGRPAAISCRLASPLPAEELATRLMPWVEDGRLVPLRLVEHRLLPSATQGSAVTGFLQGRDEADCEVLAASLAPALA